MEPSWLRNLLFHCQCTINCDWQTRRQTLFLSEAVLQHETVLERMYGRVWQRETNSVYTKHIRYWHRAQVRRPRPQRPWDWSGLMLGNNAQWSSTLLNHMYYCLWRNPHGALSAELLLFSAGLLNSCFLVLREWHHCANSIQVKFIGNLMVCCRPRLVTN